MKEPMGTLWYTFWLIWGVKYFLKGICMLILYPIFIGYAIVFIAYRGIAGIGGDACDAVWAIDRLRDMVNKFKAL